MRISTIQVSPTTYELITSNNPARCIESTISSRRDELQQHQQQHRHSTSSKSLHERRLQNVSMTPIPCASSQSIINNTTTTTIGCESKPVRPHSPCLPPAEANIISNSATGNLAIPAADFPPSSFTNDQPSIPPYDESTTRRDSHHHYHDHRHHEQTQSTHNNTNITRVVCSLTESTSTLSNDHGLTASGICVASKSPRPECEPSPATPTIQEQINPSVAIGETNQNNNVVVQLTAVPHNKDAINNDPPQPNDHDRHHDHYYHHHQPHQQEQQQPIPMTPSIYQLFNFGCSSAQVICGGCTTSTSTTTSSVFCKKLGQHPSPPPPSVEQRSTFCAHCGRRDATDDKLGDVVLHQQPRPTRWQQQANRVATQGILSPLAGSCDTLIVSTESWNTVRNINGDRRLSMRQEAAGHEGEFFLA